MVMKWKWGSELLRLKPWYSLLFTRYLSSKSVSAPTTIQRSQLPTTYPNPTSSSQQLVVGRLLKNRIGTCIFSLLLVSIPTLIRKRGIHDKKNVEWMERWWEDWGEGDVGFTTQIEFWRGTFIQGSDFQVTKSSHYLGIHWDLRNNSIANAPRLPL